MEFELNYLLQKEKESISLAGKLKNDVNNKKSSSELIDNLDKNHESSGSVSINNSTNEQHVSAVSTDTINVNKDLNSTNNSPQEKQNYEVNSIGTCIGVHSISIYTSLASLNYFF